MISEWHPKLALNFGIFTKKVPIGSKLNKSSNFRYVNLYIEIWANLNLYLQFLNNFWMALYSQLRLT